MYLKVVGNENVKYKIHTMKDTIMLGNCFTMYGTSLLVDFSVFSSKKLPFSRVFFSEIGSTNVLFQKFKWL